MVPKTTVEKVQTVQTLAMIWITGSSKYQNSAVYMIREDMLKETGWISVRQPIVYYSIVMMWKVRNYMNLVRLVFWMERKCGRRARIETTERCWTKKTVQYYNRLDGGIMEGENNNKVKYHVRKWLEENASAFHDD